MFGIGSGEMLVFAVVVLIALGPKRLPDFMRTVGKGIREIRKATTDLRKHSGIDELMRDDPAGLRALSRDISRDPAPRREQKLSAHDLAKESPVEGVDIAHAHYLAKKNAAAAAKEAAVARNAEESVTVGATVAIEPAPGSEPTTPPTGFEGDTVPDEAKAASPVVRNEPTMLGIPVADPYALPAKSASPKPKASAPPPPPPAPPSSRASAPSSAPSKASAPPTPSAAVSAAPSARPSAPPPVPAPLQSAPPPPPPIAPSTTLSGKRPSLPPAPSLSPSVPPPAADKPNARESTMAIEVEDLTLDDT